MKTIFYLLLIFTLFLGSCSTRNSVSHNFSKRKYTKGHYKPERGHYNLAKTKESKSEEGQFT
ncbi:MAG: hypothetical protein KDC84_10940 [Crocinitomicaceae bacterium]|nr:hypothetical protein [Crocinitomicaceae bacterium]